ncbi:hypothetical protein N7522_005177 [Penicillium canescens]|nr:hypothetical protein N7522_005177 [Penicillium canescens]
MNLTTYGHCLVAVFVGGTSGIGDSTARAFAQHRLFRIYLVGRNKEQASKIAQDIQGHNLHADMIFLNKDVSRLRAVDEVCQEIKVKEKEVDLLFLSTGISKGGEFE